jgi:hypothetical protein
METEDIIRSERKKSLADIQELTRLKHLNKFEISTLQKVIQERESQCELLEKTSAEREMLKRANNSLEQQLTSQTDAINAMNTASELFRGLMQSKNNEIELLQRENQRYATIETEIQQLRQTLEEYQQQIKGLLTSNNTELFVRVKTESDVKANQSRLCDTEIKKRKLSSSNDS